MKKPTVRREDLAPGDCLCEHCTGKCCRYFSLPIATPATWAQFDQIIGYLAHPKSLVYVDKETWYLLVRTRCKYLGADNRCGIYLTRPKVCWEYTTEECEYDEDWRFEKVFEAPEQLTEYAEAILPRRRSLPRQPALTGAHRAGRECRCFQVPIEAPSTWDDYDAIRWYLAHGQTLVFVEKGQWVLLVLSGARTSPRADRCRVDPGAYPSSDSGEGHRFEKVFETPEQLWEYAEAALPRRRRRRGGGPALPVISLG